MLKVWFPTSQKGFSVVEVILAATVFGLLVTALTGAIIYGRSSTAQAGDRARAQLLAEEGIEAVRNIRDASYGNLSDGTFGLAQSGNQWIFSGSSDVTGIYTRQIVISSGGTDKKDITSTVTWSGTGGSRQVSVTSRLTNWQASIVPPITPGPIMMAYSKTTTTPFYRTWNGTTWSAEGSANAVVGNINYIVLKSSRTRNEAILGVQTSTGAIYVQVWNGTSWGSLTQVGTGPTTTRSFDIAYEKNGDRAIIAFTPSSGAVDFAYRTWDGATLSSATNVTSSPTTGAINWIEMKQNPLTSSNEIAFILLDANVDVYGMAWTGSTWSTMGTAAVWDASASIATKKSIDVDYEQTSGKAMFFWGDSIATTNNYRTWNGTTLSGVSTLSIAAASGVTEWVQLAARPSSNEIMVGIQDVTPGDLNTRKWSGSAWDTATEHPEHSAATENTASRNFDIVWETHPSNLGKAWLVWGDGATVSKRQWSGTAWGTSSLLIATGTDDTSFVRLRADSASGAIFAGLYESTASATDDIWESHLTGGSATWTAKNTIWGGPTTADPTQFKIDIATP